MRTPNGVCGEDSKRERVTELGVLRRGLQTGSPGNAITFLTLFDEVEKNQTSLMKFVKIGFLELSSNLKKSAGSGDLENPGVGENIEKN